MASYISLILAAPRAQRDAELNALSFRQFGKARTPDLGGMNKDVGSTTAVLRDEAIQSKAASTLFKHPAVHCDDALGKKSATSCFH
jgi:hypothetical protein